MEEAPTPTTSSKKENPTTLHINAMDTESATNCIGIQAKLPTTVTASAKTLKRCLSVPSIIQNVPPTTTSSRGNVGCISGSRICGSVTTRSAAATALRNAQCAATAGASSSGDVLLETPKKDSAANNSANNSLFLNNVHIGIPRSNPSSREVSPSPMFNIFAPRARRYSASYSPMNVAGTGNATLSSNGTPLCLTPRVSQLRQEECVDVNSREVNHEREIHNAMQMSQSWEDLTLVTENWSCKSDEFSNPLQVILPTAGASGCSSPSPTSTRAGLRLPYGLSPSPTRRTFQTRRSMSPIAMRPSQLGAVKRKFEMDEINNGTQGNWNVYSPPPLKKIFTESRGSSPSSVCPSPDSGTGTYDGRMTPKLFISKLCTSSAGGNSTTTGSTSSASSISSSSGVIEPMICGSSSIDEGVSGSESEEKNAQGLITPIHTINLAQSLCSSSSATDMQDDVTIMDDTKSETSSIGGCSSFSIESSSWDSTAKTAANFLSQLSTTSSTGAEDGGFVSSSSSHIPIGLSAKNFFINKPFGNSGTKKFIVNHADNMPNSSSCSEPGTPDSINVSSSSGGAVLNMLPHVDNSDISSSSNGLAGRNEDVIVEN